MTELDIDKARIEIPEYYKSEAAKWIKSVRSIYAGLYNQFEEENGVRYPQEICGPVAGGLAVMLADKFRIERTADEATIPRVEVETVFYLGDKRGVVPHRVVNVFLKEDNILSFDPTFEHQYGSGDENYFDYKEFTDEVAMSEYFTERKMLSKHTLGILGPNAAQLILYREESRKRDNGELGDMTSPIFTDGEALGGTWACYTLDTLEGIVDTSLIAQARESHKRDVGIVNHIMEVDGGEMKDRLMKFYTGPNPLGKYSVKYAVEKYGLNLDLNS